MTAARSVTGFVTGRVQGVGFRYFMLRRAQALGVTGYARNLSDGRVEFRLQGTSAAVDRMLQAIRQGPTHARVADLEYTEQSLGESDLDSGFVIR